MKLGGGVSWCLRAWGGVNQAAKSSQFSFFLPVFKEARFVDLISEQNGVVKCKFGANYEKDGFVFFLIRGNFTLLLPQNGTRIALPLRKKFSL